MIKSVIPAAPPMGCHVPSSKTASSQAYSVQSLLTKSEDNSILDLSVKEKRMRGNPVDDAGSMDGINMPDDLPEIQNPERMKQLLLNVILQREFQSQQNSRKINCPAGDCIQQPRAGLDQLQKFCNPPQNLPWNFLRPLVSNLSESGTNMLSQFQKFLFNRASPNQQLNHPHSIYPRRKTLFPHSSADSIPNYFQSFSQLFNTRLNASQSSDAAAHLPLLGDGFSKQYSNSTIDINAHFSLQNILKSTSNRKRKRTKVTDTRLPRRNTTQGLTTFSQIHEPPIPEPTRFSTYLNPPSNSSQSSHSDETPGDPKRYTLTPIHLRKAKLMFLYTRYPNSQMLKSYFPDITFYKQNTAQLVKWFSNFREFYYSEMEKAVQRAISNGIQHAKDIDVTMDSELFKNLMTHFNKKKQIVVPCEFLTTVQITLREFFDAISAGKNLHQSWKKPIYKTIAKLDQMLPEFFKDMNWMMELAKDENDNINN